MFNIFLFSALSAISLLFTGKRGNDLSYYAYAAPKIRLMLDSILSPGRVKEKIMLEKIGNIEDFEKMKRKEMIDFYGGLKEFLPPDLQLFPDILKERFVIDSVLAKLKSKESIEGSELDKSYLSLLNNYSSVGISTTEFKLNRLFYKRLMKSLRKKNAKLLRKWYATKIDCENFRMILKSKTLMLKPVEDFFPKGHVSLKILEKLSSTKNTDHFIKTLRKIKGYKKLAKMLRESKQEPEIVFEKFFFERGLKLSKKMRWDIEMVMGVLVLKEIETRNFQIVMNARSLRFPPENLNEVMIGV